MGQLKAAPQRSCRSVVDMSSRSRQKIQRGGVEMHALHKFESSSSIMIIEKSVNMASLMIPAVVDVRGIVLDMMPVVSPDADAVTIDWSIFMAMRLVSLCKMAKQNE